MFFLSLLLCFLLQSRLGIGRYTAPEHTVGISISGVNVSCNSTATCSSVTGATMTAPSGTTLGGTITLVATQDATGGISGGTGISGNLAFGVICNGSGPATIAQINGSQTNTVTYVQPTCSNVTNTGQLQFRITGGGGGTGTPNMYLNAPSTVVVHWR